MAERPLLTTLLAQTLVAFTIEFDNEAERRLPHRTTEHGRTAGTLPSPWLVSMAMYFNCMRWVAEQGSTLGELQRRARTSTNLDGMQRWGYIYLAPAPGDPRPKPPQKDWNVYATPGGRNAQRIWEPLLPEMESRWRERLGAAQVARLRAALEGIVSQIDPSLPDCMPIVAYGLFSTGDRGRGAGRKLMERTASSESAAELPLPALLARILMAIAAEFEADFDLSLALSANALRLLDERPMAVRELSERAGISREYVSVATGWLSRHGYALIENARGPGRGKTIRLNDKGLVAQNEAQLRLRKIENDWKRRHSIHLFTDLHDVLEPLAGDGIAGRSALFEGLEPNPENWRAKIRTPTVLPHFPLVTHRGGYPDGS